MIPQKKRTYLVFRSCFLNIAPNKRSEPEFLDEMIDSTTGAVKVQDEHGKSHCAKKLRKVSDQRMMGT